MKKIYTTPSVDFTEIEAQDVLMASGGQLSLDDYAAVEDGNKYTQIKSNW